MVGVEPFSIKQREADVPVASRLAKELWYEFHRSKVCSGALPNSAGMATGRGEAAREAFEVLCRGVGRTGMACEPATGVCLTWPEPLIERSRASCSIQSEFKLSEEGPME